MTEQDIKLTDWPNEPKLSVLTGDLDQAKPAHDSHMVNVERWNNLLHVKNASKLPIVKGRSSIQPKLIRRQAEWRYSALTEPFLGTNKLFKVAPVTFEDSRAAEQNELLLNWQFRTKINKIKFIDNYVRATADDGSSVLRVGWNRKTKMVQEEVPVFTYYAIENEEQLMQFQQAVEMAEVDPTGFQEAAPPEVKAAVEYFKETQNPTYAVQTGSDLVDVEKVLENNPTVDVLNIKNVFIDPSCEGDLGKALFVVVSFETNKAELLKSDNYIKEQIDKIDWNSNTPLATPDHKSTTPDTFQFSDDARKKVVAYEYWGYYDIDNSGSLTPFVATWIGSTCIRMQVSPFRDGKLPFVLVPFLPIKNALYGETDAELLEDNQKIVGAVSRGMIDLLGRSANGQQGFAKGMLDPLNRRRYENGQDYEFNPNISPQQGLIEHKYPELPQSGLTILALQNQEAEALTGVKSFSGGISGESYGQVAAGIRGALDAASKREMAILRRLAKGITEVGNKFIAMNAEFLSEKEVVRVTNKQFVMINRDDLVGNFDLEVDISTAEVDEAKSSDLAFMLQTIGPNMDPTVSMKLLAEIAKLKRMPELAHDLLNYKPEPSPEQQELQQLALEKARKEVQLLDADINLKMAQAQKAKADADLKDLDFVEQETGTKHERDLQKQRAQSQGNQNLEVTKALVRSRKKEEADPSIEAAVGFNQISGKLSSSS